MKVISNTYTIEVTHEELNYIIVALYERVTKLEKHKKEGASIDEYKLSETSKLLDEILDMVTD